MCIYIYIYIHIYWEWIYIYIHIHIYSLALLFIIFFSTLKFLPFFCFVLLKKIKSCLFLFLDSGNIQLSWNRTSVFWRSWEWLLSHTNVKQVFTPDWYFSLFIFDVSHILFPPLFFLNCFLLHCVNFNKIFNVYLFLRDRQSMSRGGAEGEREPQNSKWAPGSVLSAPLRGSNSQTVRSWPELKSRVECLTNWATQMPLEYIS